MGGDVVAYTIKKAIVDVTDDVPLTLNLFWLLTFPLVALVRGPCAARAAVLARDRGGRRRAVRARAVPLPQRDRPQQPGLLRGRPRDRARVRAHARAARSHCRRWPSSGHRAGLRSIALVAPRQRARRGDRASTTSRSSSRSWVRARSSAPSRGADPDASRSPRSSAASGSRPRSSPTSRRSCSGGSTPRTCSASRTGGPAVSEGYPLRIVELLSPVAGHRLAPFAWVSDQLSAVGRHGLGTANLGLAAAIGFCIGIGALLLAPLIRPRAAAAGSSSPASASSMLIAFFFGAAGGLAASMELVGLQGVRAWNRIAIVIAFAGDRRVRPLPRPAPRRRGRCAPGSAVRWSGTPCSPSC